MTRTISPRSSHSSGTPLHDTEGLATLKDIWKAVGVLPLPDPKGPSTEQEACQNQFLKDLAQSEHSRFFSFHLLASLTLNTRRSDRPKLFPLRARLVDILTAGRGLTRLEECTSEEITQWVTNSCRCDESAQGVNQWLATGDYLAILYTILRTKDIPRVFRAALLSFAEEFVRLDSVRSCKATTAIHKTVPVKVFASLAQEIINLAPNPAKPNHSLITLLAILMELDAYCRPIHVEHQRLHEAVLRAEATHAAMESELAARTDALSEAEAENRRLSDILRQAQQDLGHSEGLLDMAKGHHASDREMAVGEALAHIRRECGTRLEDIRLYAEQKDPDKDAIIRLSQEIEASIENYGRGRS